jgi:hypothetical protein
MSSYDKALDSIEEVVVPANNAAPMLVLALSILVFEAEKEEAEAITVDGYQSIRDSLQTARMIQVAANNLVTSYEQVREEQIVWLEEQITAFWNEAKAE